MAAQVAPQISPGSLASLINITRRAMLDMGNGAEYASHLEHSCTPGSFPADSPAAEL